jgi:DNA primase
MKTTTKLPDLVPVDLENALDDLGITGRIRGDELTALCPNPQHADSSPSWSINLDTGKHHCFSCGFGGSFQWLVQIMRGVRAGEATAWIKMQKVRIGVPEEVNEKQPVVTEADLYEFGEPPEWALKERGISAESCEALEILWWEKHKMWVFPLRDPFTDRLIGWQTKGTGENSHIVDNVPLRMKKATTVFGYRNLKHTGVDGAVVVLENPVKAGRVFDAGYSRVVSTCGSSFTDYQINDLLWPVADHVILMLDNDPAGHKAVHRFIMENPYARSSTFVFSYGESVRTSNGAYIHTPDGRDPGDLSNIEIVKGILNATPAAFTYFEGIDWT